MSYSCVTLYYLFPILLVIQIYIIYNYYSVTILPLTFCMHDSFISPWQKFIGTFHKCFTIIVLILCKTKLFPCVNYVLGNFVIIYKKIQVITLKKFHLTSLKFWYDGLLFLRYKIKNGKGLGYCAKCLQRKSDPLSPIVRDLLC